MKRRIVVTGMSGVTALGSNYDEILLRLKKFKNAVVVMEDWQKFNGLHTKLAAPIRNFQTPAHYTRKQLRSMGRVAKLATVATDQALKMAQFHEHPSLSDGSTGIAYGSSTGSTPPILSFTNMFHEHSTRGITATTYLQLMAHTCPVNVGLFFGIKGRLIPTSSACTSASQAIGYSYEAIKYGKQKAMVAGGGEELCPSEAAVFDILFATSTKNDQPDITPAPYDKDRDGLVLGEGAGSLVLEDLDHAKNRGATIFAELVGFGTNCDAEHLTHPDFKSMAITMQIALDDAGLKAGDIGYISAHATATEGGDIAESKATASVFGSQTPISAMKSYFGHTLGACGAIEAWLAIEMMNRGWFAPTINLHSLDSRCAELDYIDGEGRNLDCEFVMSNNFGFGGINTSLVFKRWND